jgi:hypothetical protein
MSALPIGFSEAARDWNVALAKREMTYRDWSELTLGEQARYAARECQTKGAVYSSRITGNEITFSVKLPPTLAMTGLTADEARCLEGYLHRKLEEQIVAILQLRQYASAGERP